MDRIAALAIAGTFIAFAAGCSSSPSRFYTLSATAASGPAPSKVSVAVGPVSIPASVDRPQIVVSTSANQVALDDYNRWASPLQDDIARVVAENLVALLGTPKVTRFPQSSNGDAEYRVQIEVRNFESVPGKSASLDAVWTVRRVKDAKNETGRTSAREKVEEDSFDALAAAHSRALAALSRDIADTLRKMERPAP